MKMKRKQLTLQSVKNNMLKFFIIICSFLVFFCNSADKFYSPCQEKCKYIEQDCLSLCGPGGISFTFDYGSNSKTGVLSCHERCGLIYSRCLNECFLRKKDEE